MKHLHKAVSSLLVFLSLFSATLVAQVSGTITGSITDPAGAAVAGATVTVTNQDTGVATKVQSSGAGIYAAPVRAGVYRIETEMSGFKKEMRPDIRVGVLQSLTVDMKLQLGSITEQVTVTGAPPLLNTVSGTMSTNVSPREYSDLPLFFSNGMRGATAFLGLLPGANSDTGTGGGTFYVNGGQGRSGELQLDGVSVSTQQFAGDSRGFQVPVDTIQEFTVLTNSFSAEFGRTGGGIQSFTLKSGTNALHGSLYEFARNDAFDARGFYAASVPVVKQHEFGVNVGGPLTIPKLYHGKDRTFFFMDYTGYRYNTKGTNYTTTVPTTKFRTGDFTEYVDSKGAMIPLYDPNSTTTDASGNQSRTPFTGNLIPSSRLSKIAQQVQSYVPQPTRSGFLNNYVSMDHNTNRQDNGTIRIDHNLSEKHKLSGSLVANNWDTTNPAALPDPIGAKNGQNLNSRIARVSHDWIMRPTMINHLNVAFNRLVTATVYAANGVDWASQLGLIGRQGTLRGFPSFATGFGNFGGGGLVANYDTTWNFLDSLSWQHGRHAIKFGGEIRSLQTNMANAGGEPSFSFGAGVTCFPTPQACPNTGNSYAGYLMGLATGSGLYINPNMFGGRWRQYMMYAQDDWKITPRLTLNLGLRYEIPIPFREVNNRLSNVDLNLANPGAGNTLGALVFMKDYSQQTGNNSFYGTSMREFGPRFGLAYALPWNMVLRAGYGIYYNAGSGIGNGGNGQTTGYSSNPSFSATSAYGWDVNVDTQGWRTDRYVAPPFLDPSYGNGGNMTSTPRNAGRSPYMQNWNFGFQKQMKGDILLDFSYVGSKGTRLVTGRTWYEVKELDPKYWYLSAGPLMGLNIRAPAVAAAGFTPPYPTFDGSLAQALAPYPQFSRFNITQNDGNSTYHSFQFKAQKRFSNGVSFLISYTGSKTIGDSFSVYNRVNTYGLPNMYGRDKYNKSLDKVLAPYDRTHLASIAFVYELPFGHGKPLAHNGRLLDLIVGGWQLNGVLSYASGQPLPVTGPGTISNVNARSYTPNNVDGVPQTLNYGSKWDPATSVYLNRAAFSMPPLGTLGYSGFMLGGNVRWLANKNENLGLFKNISLTESVKLQLRLEANDVFNRFVPSNPDTAWNLTTTTFGKSFGQANTPRFLQVAGKLTF